MVPWFEIEQCEKKNGWLFDIGGEILVNYMGIIYWLVFSGLVWPGWIKINPGNKPGSRYMMVYPTDG